MAIPPALRHFRRLLYFACLVLTLVLNPQTARSSSLNIKVHDSRIDIQTEDASMYDILEAIFQKTGISFKACLSSSEPVTLEDCLKRALSKGNYAIIFKKTANGEFSPVEIRLFGEFQGTESNKTLLSDESFENSSEERNDPRKQYNRNVFIQAFREPDALLDQISVEKVEVEEYPNGNGLKIDSLDDYSVFREIGLQTGDVVLGVNDKPVQTVEDIIHELRASVMAGSPSIRLERLNANGKMNPIYIELH